MLKIRMQRVGRRNDPSFRVVVLEHTSPPKAGKYVEKVGTYNPKTKSKMLNTERIKYWLSVGAQASPTMHNMLVSAGIVEGKKINVLPKKSPPKKEEEVKTEASETPAETPPEAPPADATPSESAAASETPTA